MSDVLRLLYIDDDALFARLVTRALRRDGIETTHADRGEPGLALLAAGGFDAVALDHMMPGMTGLETLAAIARLPAPPPVIYVTAADEGRIAVAALKAGAADYVLKDAGDTFSELLAETIRQAIAGARLRAAKEAADAAVREARDRAEMLLKEVNHRVANSLALVNSMAHLQGQASDSPEVKAALKAMQRRIAAIGQVHQRLYTSDDVRAVSMDSYLSGLLQEMQQAMADDGAKPQLILEAEPILLATDQAISIGVVVTELVTNAWKYAYPAGAAGEVRVAFHRVDEGLCLVVADDGVGFDVAASPRGSGLGSRLVKAMAAGLRGRLRYEANLRGTRASLLFAA
ncbi:sensor histidine kinase [Sandaracinobacteroides saxicola]|uniref:histidine kinase n=1 Tax=Sandaracinobacteroides saxicola TaxID=2759707 RepID=A0A7G5IJD3_9SPHN|nr:response regulator [Sandaracinobacteroides saxicola]QMW23475.1 response regulator [Sandaracinobacteroides saxicola]